MPRHNRHHLYRARHDRNDRCVQAGEKMADYVATTVHNAHLTLIYHLNTLDGYVAAPSDTEKISGTSNDTAPERLVIMRDRLETALQDINQAIAVAAAAIDDLAHKAEKGLRLADPDHTSDLAAVCSDNQHGMDGAIEWGDPLCNKLPVKRGLCERCYKRSRRWRHAHGIDTAKDFAA